MDSGGDVAFAADFEETSVNPCAPGNFQFSNGEGAFLWSKGQLSQITRTGLPAPGGGTLTFGVYGFSSINDPGDVAFVFGLEPSMPPELEGFPKAGLYRYSHVTQTLSAVVVPGVSARWRWICQRPRGRVPPCGVEQLR